MAFANRKEYLQRLIMGLDQSIENQKGMLPYYEPGDLEGMYAKKFLAKMEEELEKAKIELHEILEKEAKEAKDAK